MTRLNIIVTFKNRSKETQRRLQDTTTITTTTTTTITTSTTTTSTKASRYERLSRWLMAT
ncbi:hypothetical protein E2C01_083062 [Portunus trituberculatus]|uniref:Uncharacterized protein n=1 Tax=Portunus trituberculatus TaxID=210409 RepID=A0A5B7J5E7_PORTR|nr:hypothetical protein [Portunus trituberculatus]